MSTPTCKTTVVKTSVKKTPRANFFGLTRHVKNWQTNGAFVHVPGVDQVKVKNNLVALKHSSKQLILCSAEESQIGLSKSMLKATDLIIYHSIPYVAPYLLTKTLGQIVYKIC